MRERRSIMKWKGGEEGGRGLVGGGGGTWGRDALECYWRSLEEEQGIVFVYGVILAMSIYGELRVLLETVIGRCFGNIAGYLFSTCSPIDH